MLGFASQAFGSPYLQGGVKYVAPAGWLSYASGSAAVVNTKADQRAYPAGISSPAIPGPLVSPRFLRPSGISGPAMGIALVQFPPRPQGWDSAKYGTPTVLYKTRFLRPGGIADGAAGFPRVADRAQRVLHSASPVTTIFGDTTLSLKNFRVRVPGINALETSDWTELRNRNRGLQAPGIGPGTANSPEVRNKSPALSPIGIGAPNFGATDIGHRVRAVRPAGLPPPAPAFGLPSFWQTPALQPPGISSPAVPAPVVQNGIRYLGGAGGTATDEHGRTMVGFRYRHIAPGGFAAPDYGLPRLEHRDRTVLAQSFAETAYGTPLLTLARRFLVPAGIRPVEEGANHMVGGTRWLRPIGFESTRWGTRIIPEARTLYLAGFGGAFGWPKLENQRQYVKPDSIRLYNEPQQYFGLGRAFNSRQYIAMFYDVDSELTPPRWPQWTLIENRNKRMGVSGWDASKVAAPRVENAARVILPAGAQAPSLPVWQRTGMVAFRVRPLRLDGLEPPYIASWSNVRNAARLLKPSGLVATGFGTAKMENRSREFNRIGGWDSAWFGYPFLAPRIRELSFEGRYTIAPPIVPLPRLQLHTRYIAPKSIDPKEVGAAALEIHFTRVTPRWTMVSYWGYPAVRNVTPEVRQRGAAMDEWGNARVRLQWRAIAPDGTNMAFLGKPIIADSRRTVGVPGTNMLRVGDKITVTKTGVPPLGTQYIWLDSLDPVNWPNNGHGIPPNGYPESQVGKPSMQQQVVYPNGINPETLFGRPRVTANSIRVEPGIFDLTVGEPMVSLLRRTIVASSVKHEVEYGKPRFSPHTIYAVTEAPPQAIVNHGGVDLHPVRSWAEFGLPVVQNRHRAIEHRFGYDGMSFGYIEIHNSRQYVSPEGKLMSRMGWATIPGDSLIEFYSSINTMAVGVPTVAHPPYVGPQTVRPVGYDAAQIEVHRAEHFNRTLLASGHDSAALGGPKYFDTPYMWQGLRVGALMPTVPDGFNAEQFGKAWISHWVREVAAEGFDAFRSEYDYQAFAQRMRVRNATRNERLPQVLKPHGASHASVGTPGARPGAHYIRPDGNSDQYRKGVPA